MTKTCENGKSAPRLSVAHNWFSDFRVSGPHTPKLIASAPAEDVVLSSDCCVFLMPPLVEGLREFLLFLKSPGVPRETPRLCVTETTPRLFRMTA